MASGQQNRERLLRLIEDRPGISFRELLRATELGAGTVQYHLNRLACRHLIWRMEQGIRVLHFAGARPATDVQERLRLRAVTTRWAKEEYAIVLEHPGITQKEVAQMLPDRPRSTVQHHLARLVQLGVLRVRAGFRTKHYEVVA